MAAVSQHLSKLIQDGIESRDLARMNQVATEARKQARDDPNIAHRGPSFSSKRSAKPAS